MTHKEQPKPDDPEQSARFIETARAVEADEGHDAFDRAFKKVAKKISGQRAPKESP